MNETLENMLIRHEDLRLKPYRDTVGKLTIGVGRNLEDKGISRAEAMTMLANDIEEVRQEARMFPWFAALNEARQIVILNMLFNLGLARFSGFRDMLTALSAEDYRGAAVEMLDSIWAKQVGTRATELARIMETGVL